MAGAAGRDASGYPRQRGCYRQPGRFQACHGQPDDRALQVLQMGMSTADRIGVTIIWNTNSKITGTVLCPISEASPSPTVNVTIASSSIHSPASIMRESGGERKMAV